MIKALPLFYFHPTICWIDDDKLFLDVVSMTFKNHFNCLTFERPEEALQFFSTYEAPLSNINFTREFTESDVSGTNHHLPVDLNISALTNLAKIQHRANEITTIIVDYNMPNMNGLELCEKIKTTPFKKILLTGESNHAKAVEAFNQNLIDKFIRKDHELSDILQNYINELSYQYFYEKTANLILHIEASRSSPLSDPIFINFFYHWCQSNSIQEFYLINRQGSFLAKNNEGKLICFVVMNEHEKNEFIKLNDELIDEIGMLLNELSEEKSIPFFGIGKESWDVDLDQWQNHFYPANVLEGRERYYWAVVGDGE